MYFSTFFESKNKDYSNMNDKFENQKERLLAIKQEISLLYQQVNYLLRNEKPLELLDLDVLMNRTHTLYDQLCAINLGEEVDDEDLPFEMTLSGCLAARRRKNLPNQTKKKAPSLRNKLSLKSLLWKCHNPSPNP